MIPKKIHYCWLGNNPLPPLAKKCIATWRKYCPDYEIIRWDESNYDFSTHPYMKQAFDARKWGFVPDYARLDIVHKCGGIYLDTDVELIRPLDDLLNNKCFMGFETAFSVALGLGFGAEAGHEMLQKMIPRYIKEGKYHLNIAFGCTGGQHRSVSMANHMSKVFKEDGYRVTLKHRDL